MSRTTRRTVRLSVRLLFETTLASTVVQQTTSLTPFSHLPLPLRPTRTRTLWVPRLLRSHWPCTADPFLSTTEERRLTRCSQRPSTLTPLRPSTAPWLPQVSLVPKSRRLSPHICPTIQEQTFRYIFLLENILQFMYVYSGTSV